MDDPLVGHDKTLGCRIGTCAAIAIADLYPREISAEWRSWQCQHRLNAGGVELEPAEPGIASDLNIESGGSRAAPAELELFAIAGVDRRW